MKYIWIIVLVMLFEFLGLLPFKKHFVADIDSVSAIVTFGNSIGAFFGFLASLLIDVLAISFCEFFGIKWHTIATTIPTVGTILGAFGGFVYMIIDERK